MNKPWRSTETYWSMETGEKIGKTEAKKHYNVNKVKIVIYEDRHFKTREKQYYCEKWRLRLF